MDVVIFGTSKVAQSVYSFALEEGVFNVAGFCIDSLYYQESQMFGLPVVKFEEIEMHFPPDQYRMLVAVGYHRMNHLRERRCAEAEAKGYQLCSYISPRATIATNVKLGKNCIVMAHASIEPFAQIGNNVCIFDNSTLAHHDIVEDNVWVGSGVIVAGGTRIGHHSFLGVGATIGHNIEIGAENFIGAHALVTKNTEVKSVYICPDTPKYRLNTDDFLRLTKFQ